MTDEDRLLEIESTDIRRLLERAINLCSAENNSDTPDFILADFLVGCLFMFDSAVRRRREWWGDKERSGFGERTGAREERGQDVPDALLDKAIRFVATNTGDDADAVYCALRSIQRARAAGKGKHLHLSESGSMDRCDQCGRPYSDAVHIRPIPARAAGKGD